MDLELDGKVAVVTGASKGIGLAITRALAAEGARVVAGARTTDTLDGLDAVTAVPVDLAAPDGPGLLVQRAIDDHGRVDVLVNNVGAVRLRLQGILVNCVSPGPVNTDLWLGEHGVAETVAAATGTDADTARDTVVAGIGGFATGRFTTPEEVATFVVVLASPRAANVTGANYVID